METDTLYSKLNEALGGTHVAIRVTTRLMPAGGMGTKVFPPTYATDRGGKYAYEDRLVNGGVIRTVLLDSVQSQANRMEQALLEAYRSGKVGFPLVNVSFEGKEELKDLGIKQLTSLEVPHRLADATILYSLKGDKEFRYCDEGEALESASITNATPLFKLSPTALIFGQWLSHGRKGGLGSKFPRCIVSEIVGFNAVEGIRVGGRIDPLPISAEVPVYTTPDGEWTLDEKEHTEKKKEKEKASNIGLGNIPPSFKDKETKENLVGGVTIDHAEQVAVLSLISLRRLRFPVDGRESQEANRAARMVLTTLALCAISMQIDEGFDLRSRCLLVPQEKTKWELIPRDSSLPVEFKIDSDQAVDMFKRAVQEAESAGLPWRREALVLKPSRNLIELIKRSMQIRTGEQIEVG